MMKIIGNKLNRSFLQYISLMVFLLLFIAILCILEINGACASRPPTAHCVCVHLIDRLQNYCLTQIYTEIINYVLFLVNQCPFELSELFPFEK